MDSCMEAVHAQLRLFPERVDRQQLEFECDPRPCEERFQWTVWDQIPISGLEDLEGCYERCRGGDSARSCVAFEHRKSAVDGTHSCHFFRGEDYAAATSLPQSPPPGPPPASVLCSRKRFAPSPPPMRPASSLRIILEEFSDKAACLASERGDPTAESVRSVFIESIESGCTDLTDGSEYINGETDYPLSGFVTGFQQEVAYIRYFEGLGCQGSSVDTARVLDVCLQNFRYRSEPRKEEATTYKKLAVVMGALVLCSVLVGLWARTR